MIRGFLASGYTTFQAGRLGVGPLSTQGYGGTVGYACGTEALAPIGMADYSRKESKLRQKLSSAYGRILALFPGIPNPRPLSGQRVLVAAGYGVFNLELYRLRLSRYTRSLSN